MSFKTKILFIILYMEAPMHGTLSDGEGSVQLVSSLRLRLFCKKGKYSFSTKRALQDKEANCTKLSPSVRLPCKKPTGCIP